MAEGLAPLRGWQHPAGTGIRGHVLVIPSVICAAQAALTIAEGVPGAVAIEHQHGCAQLGGDARLTEQVLTGLGVHPNVGGTLVVSLGCETVQGVALHRAIAGRGQRAEFVGIQQAGGTGAAVKAGRDALERLGGAARADPAVQLAWGGLCVGVEGAWLDAAPCHARVFLGAIEWLRHAGSTVIQAAPSGHDAGIRWRERLGRVAGVPLHAGSPLFPDASLPYAVRPSGPGLFLMESPSSRIVQKTGLAAAGAHVIVSPFVAGLPAGCPVAPVVHVGIAPYARPFAGDIDVLLDVDPAPGAMGSIIDAIVAACHTETALESIGGFEMAVHRIGPTM